MLEIAGLTVRFGGVTALHDVELAVPDGSVCGLIGPNGAGKTTLFNCVSRLVEPAGGSIRFDGTEVLEKRPHEIAQLGIARTFQHLALIPSLTVRENVMLGAHYRSRTGFVAAALRLPRTKREEEAARHDADEALARMDLTAIADHPASGLAYGQLKRIELARALCETPRLLALDEPASGLSHGEVNELADLLKALTQELDLTLLLVEHHMGLVMQVSDLVAVLDFGRIIATGPPDEVRNDAKVIEAYFRSARVILEVDKLNAGYGPVNVLSDVSFGVDDGETVALLGANGAGKTTTLRAICGMLKPKGTVTLLGKNVTGRATEQIVKLGVAHVPEGRGTFAPLTVEENLKLGAFTRRGHGPVERVFSLFPRLQERRTQRAGTLSGGEQQMLAIGRALMLQPKLMLLDEPSLGLAPNLTRELFKVLRTIKEDEGTAMLIVEQNANLVLEFADAAHVLETGRVVLSGSAQEVQQDESMRKAYLGY